MAASGEQRKAHEQLEAIFRALPDLLFELSPDGTILSYRAGRAEDLYTTPGDFLGKRMADVLPPEPGRLLQSALGRVGAGDSLVAVEYTLTVSGAAKHFEARLVPIDGGNVIVVVRDVTEQRRVVDERRELDRQVLEAQRLESLGLLAGGLAHDFNNLLAAILASADLVARHVPDGSPMSVPLEIVRQSAWRASELSRQLLAYAGKGRMEPQHFDVRALVLDTAQLLGAARAPGARLDLDLPVGLPAVHGDVAQLRQVVMNLITNAADAVGDDGHVRLSARPIEADDARWVDLVVEDDGVGMDDATRDRMFDPFFSTKGAGRGLGLAAVLGIVRSHDGRIDVDSGPGRGTRVRVRLPASDAPPEPLATGLAKWTDRRIRGTVLVVDDEPAVRDATAAILADAGLVVHTAEDGRHALDILERGRRFDAIVLDVTMPRMGGLETLAAIRALDPQVPVLLISGYSDDERLRAAAPHGFLQKPFPAEALLAAITGALESRSR